MTLHPALSRLQDTETLVLVNRARHDGRLFTDDAFAKHWTTVHAPLATKLPGLLSYAINLPSPEQRGRRPLDGFAKLEFASWDDAKAAWASEAGRATAADGALFMARARPLIVEEHIVVPRGGIPNRP